MLKKENTTLLIALSLPIILIVVVLLSIYIPRFLAPEPQIDFIYSIEDNYYYGGSQFVIKNSIIEKKELRIDQKLYYDEQLIYMEDKAYEDPRLFFYDVSEKRSREISLEEAQKFELDSSEESSDGFSISCGTRADGFIFFVFNSSEDCRNQFVSGHGVSYKIDTNPDLSDYRYQFHFIGWIR